MARTQSTWESYGDSYVAVPWAEGRNVLIRGTDKYINFGSLVGSTGYGIRDNGGTMQFKNSAGAWANIGSGGSASWGGITGTLSDQTDLQTTLDGKQAVPVVVSGNLTAANETYYNNVASATYTDPTPVEGKGFIVFVRNGTATVGGTAYATAGTIIHRVYHSGAWANYVYSTNSTLISDTAYGAGWNADTTTAPSKNAVYDEMELRAPKASPTFTGTADFVRIDYDRAIGTVSALGNLGATETFDWSTATNFTGTLDQNITIDFSNAVSGQTIVLYLAYDGSALRTIAWTPTVEWGGGTAPTGPDASGETLVITLKYIGTTYYGSFEIFS